MAGAGERRQDLYVPVLTPLFVRERGPAGQVS
jgi:hypothetical protein